jgi:hypothetical protein
MFPNLLRKLDAADRYRCRLESFESEHLSDPVFNSAMKPLDEVSELEACLEGNHPRGAITA